VREILEEAMEWAAAIHDTMMDADSIEDFQSLQEWWFDTLERGWAEYLASKGVSIK